MPELPEVEHIAAWLRPQLTKRCIRGLSVHPGGERLVPQGAGLVQRRITGQTIRAVERRAKLILLRLDADTLAIHLKMTGQLWPGDEKHPPAATRVSVLLAGEPSALHFVDVRKFGWIRLWSEEERRAHEQEFGPEPVPHLPPDWAAGLRGARSIKAALLDQTVVAGIGNIYADEILFRAGLHPGRRIHSLSTAERERLERAVESEMAAAVAERSGVPDQKRVGGGDRSVKKLFAWRVFQREGEPCPVCGGAIVRTVEAQRGTYFCPRCQPEASGSAQSAKKR